MASSAATLLKLLKHTSAERLEVMLDPVQLVGLLGSFGHDKAEIEAQLQAGTKPGELLLALFEQHDAELVWQALPLRTRSLAKAAEEDAERGSTVQEQLDSVGVTRPRLPGAIVALTGSVWAAMYILGSVPAWGSGMTIGSLVFAVLAGLLGGAWATRDVTSTAGALAGLACALVTITLAWLVSTYSDAPPGRLIVMAVVLPGALIGLGVGGAAIKLWTKQAPKTF